MFQKGEAIEIVGDHPEVGKKGTFKWYCKLKIPGRECRVNLQPQGRQRTERTVYLDSKFITMAKAKSDVTNEINEAAAAPAPKAKSRTEKAKRNFGKDAEVIVINPASIYHNIVGTVLNEVSSKPGYYLVRFPEPTGQQILFANELELNEEVQPPFSAGDNVEIIRFNGFEGKRGKISELVASNATLQMQDGTTERFDICWLELIPAPKEPEFRNVPLKNIVPDPNQPRRHFSETDLEELMNSVREKGVVQPIVLRPADKTDYVDGTYMVVCGERRYRAARSVNAAFKDRDTIPAIIRELTDDEALDIQITENLQRKDVHPMEEALAIKSLLSHNRTLDEVAAKLGKDKRYIASRIKLNDLISEFQEAYLRGLLEHSDARIICATLPEQQVALFREEARYQVANQELPAESQIEDEEDDVYGDNDDNDFDDAEELEAGQPLKLEGLKKFDFGSYRLKHWANEQVRKLDSATFKTEDPDLYPEMGACGECPFNSSNSMLLFMEEGGRICNNGVCYGIKTHRAYQQTLQQAATDGELLFVAGYHYGDEAKAKVKAAKDLGLVVLGDSDFYSSNEKDPKARRAYAVAGHDEGKEIWVILRDSGKAKAGASVDGAPATSAKTQIAEIQARETRAKELDREKIYAQVIPLIKEHKPYLDSTEPLTKDETVALTRFLLNHGDWQVTRDFEKQFKFKNDADLIKVMAEQLQPATLNQFIRRTVLAKLLGQASDYERFGDSAAVMALARHYLPKEVAEIELLQKEKSIKRQARVDERLAALKASSKPAKNGKKEVPDAEG